MKHLFTLALLTLTVWGAQATIIRSTDSGNWADNIWETDDAVIRQPADGDTIVINAGHTVTITESVFLEDVLIEIDGDLVITDDEANPDVAATLWLNTTSVIVIAEGGSIDAEDSEDGSRILFVDVPEIPGLVTAFTGFSTADLDAIIRDVTTEIGLNNLDQVLNYIESLGLPGVVGDVVSAVYAELVGNAEWMSTAGALTGPLTLSNNSSVAALPNNYQVLPIELTDFSAANYAGEIALQWVTASELNNDYFTLERSVDGVNFEAIHYEPGAGNSNEALSYSYSDYVAENGIYYYRLKQTDYDGTATYSDVISVDYFEAYQEEPTAYVSQGTLYLDQIQVGQLSEVLVYNVNGSLIFSSSEQASSFTLSNYKPGLHVVQVKQGGRVSSLKVFIR